MEDYNYSVSCDDGRCFKFHRYTKAFQVSRDLTNRGIGNRLIILNPIIDVQPKFIKNPKKGAYEYAK